MAAMHPSLSETEAVSRAPSGCTALCDGWRLRQAPPLRSDGPPTCGTAVPLAAPPIHGRVGAARLSPATLSACHPATDASRRRRVPLPLSASFCHGDAAVLFSPPTPCTLYASRERRHKRWWNISHGRCGRRAGSQMDASAGCVRRGSHGRWWHRETGLVWDLACEELVKVTGTY